MKTQVIEIGHKALFDNVSNHIYRTMQSTTAGICPDDIHRLHAPIAWDGMLGEALCNPETARILLRNRVAAIKRFKRQGVPFTLRIRKGKMEYARIAGSDIRV